MTPRMVSGDGSDARKQLVVVLAERALRGPRRGPREQRPRLGDPAADRPRRWPRRNASPSAPAGTPPLPSGEWRRRPPGSRARTPGERREPRAKPRHARAARGARRRGIGMAARAPALAMAVCRSPSNVSRSVSMKRRCSIAASQAGPFTARSSALRPAEIHPYEAYAVALRRGAMVSGCGTRRIDPSHNPMTRSTSPDMRSCRVRQRPTRAGAIRSTPTMKSGAAKRGSRPMSWAQRMAPRAPKANGKKRDASGQGGLGFLGNA